MPQHLSWVDLSPDTKLDIILSEARRSSSLEHVTTWLCDKQTLIREIDKRGIIWDKNKEETLTSQQMFIETAALDINSQRQWKQKKQDLLTILNSDACNNAFDIKQTSCMSRIPTYTHAYDRHISTSAISTHPEMLKSRINAIEFQAVLEASQERNDIIEMPAGIKPDERQYFKQLPSHNTLDILLRYAHEQQRLNFPIDSFTMIWTQLEINSKVWIALNFHNRLDQEAYKYRWNQILPDVRDWYVPAPPPVPNDDYHESVLQSNPYVVSAACSFRK
jgi:hypothetical protein